MNVRLTVDLGHPGPGMRLMTLHWATICVVIAQGLFRASVSVAVSGERFTVTLGFPTPAAGEKYLALLEPVKDFPVSAGDEGPARLTVEPA